VFEKKKKRDLLVIYFLIALCVGTYVHTMLSINFYEGGDSLENIPLTQRVEIEREGFDCLKTIVEKFEERLTARHAKQIADRCGLRLKP